MQFRFLTSLIFSVLTGLLVFQNKQVIEVKFLFISFNISLSFVIILSVLMGYFIEFGFSVFKEIEYKKMIRDGKKSIFHLKKEISKLNNSYFSKDLQEDNIQSIKEYKKISSLLYQQDEDIDSYIDEHIKKDDKIKKNQTPISKVIEKIKQQSDDDTNELNNSITNFDDLESDDFSLKIDEKKQPWYMGDISPSSKNQEIKKEKYKSKDIDLKSDFNEHIANMKKNTKMIVGDYRILKLKNSCAYKNKKFKKIDKSIVKKRKDILEKVLLYKILQGQLKKLKNQEVEKTEVSQVKENSENKLSQDLVKEKFNWKSEPQDLESVINTALEQDTKNNNQQKDADLQLKTIQKKI